MAKQQLRVVHVAGKNLQTTGFMFCEQAEETGLLSRIMKPTLDERVRRANLNRRDEERYGAFALAQNVFKPFPLLLAQYGTGVDRRQPHERREETSES